MSFPIENKTEWLQYSFIWLLYAFVHALSLLWIIPLDFMSLLLDGIIHALLYGAIGMFLWNVILYGNYEKMPVLQRVINYGALLLLILVLWIGLGYGIDCLFLGTELSRNFIPAIPVYILVGILLFAVIVLFYRNKIALSKEEEETFVSGGRLEPEQSVKREAVVASDQEYLERIAVKSGQKIHVVMVPDIIYLQADGDYVHIFTSTGKYLKEQTMKYFEENLPENQFVRVHRSYIVNVEAISRIELYEKQSQMLTLKNGERIKTSVSGYKLLRNKLGL